jgi:hypothetical protein
MPVEAIANVESKSLQDTAESSGSFSQVPMVVSDANAEEL